MYTFYRSYLLDSYYQENGNYVEVMIFTPEGKVFRLIKRPEDFTDGTLMNYVKQYINKQVTQTKRGV